MIDPVTARPVIGFLYGAPPAWSVDGRFLALNVGGILWQWDLMAGTAERLLDPAPYDCRYLPDGRLLIVTITLDSEHAIHRFDPVRGVMEEDLARCLAGQWDISPDGRRLYTIRAAGAAPGWPRSELWEHQLATGECRRIDTAPAAVFALAVSPDGDQVLLLEQVAPRPVPPPLPPVTGEPRRPTLEAAAGSRLTVWERAAERWHAVLGPRADLHGPLCWAGPRHLFFYLSGINAIRDLTFTPCLLTLDQAETLWPLSDAPIYHARRPAISTDGHYLALTMGARREFADPGRIMLMDLKTGLSETIPDAWRPSFDPCRQRLAYLSPWPTGGADGQPRAGRLHLRDLTGSGELTLPLPLA